MLVETSRAEWGVFNPSQDLYRRALVVALISCCGGKKVMNEQMG